MSNFDQRVTALPFLGLGVSTEYGAGTQSGALDPAELRREHPTYANFLELGVEVAKGFDADAQAWLATGAAVTYHFLDINLDEAEDFDAAWLDGLNALVDQAKPAWLCGDAGLWHFGPRERGHMLLLPPILSDPSASELAEGVLRLRDATGYEVLPETPPGHVFVGDLHLLDFFARVCERADTGLLLDCAHLAIYQRAMGYDALTALDGFPLDRVVEMHVAGATIGTRSGLAFVEDDHTTDVLPETWAIFEHVVSRAQNLKAVVFECERNALPDTLPGFARLAQTLQDHAARQEAS